VTDSLSDHFKVLRAPTSVGRAPSNNSVCFTVEMRREGKSNSLTLLQTFSPSYTMATTARASVVIHVPIEKVWDAVRVFDFPSRLISTVKHTELLDGARPTEVGALRTLKWSEGETVTQRLLELSDLERRVVWETVAAEPSSEVTAAITTLQAHRITESNSTLLSWSAEFSADTKGDFINFQQKAFAANLGEIKAHLSQ